MLAVIHRDHDTEKATKFGHWQIVAPEETQPPNVGGNRRANEMLAEDQAACRRVRLTVGLGGRFQRPHGRLHGRRTTSAAGTHHLIT